MYIYIYVRLAPEPSRVRMILLETHYVDYSGRFFIPVRLRDPVVTMEYTYIHTYIHLGGQYYCWMPCRAHLSDRV